MKVLYFDCISGISGDMTVGALVDLGVKPSALEWELSKLAIGDFHMHFERVSRQAIEGVHFTIHAGSTHTPEQDEPDGHEEHGHHHDHGHEHGPAHEHAHEHSHEHDGGHTQSHAHPHEHGEECAHDHRHGEEHLHEHSPAPAHDHGRSHREIRALLEQSELSAFVKRHALGIFHRIAVAEGKIHGVPAEDVGFHEVGALDSIADIVCACVGLEALGVERIVASRLHDGHGVVQCAHGTFPVPTPATLEILRGIPLGQIDEPHELITPTGAAILAEFAQEFGLMPSLITEKIGYGIGTRDLASRPNVLRAVLGTLAEA